MEPPVPKLLATSEAAALGLHAAVILAGSPDAPVTTHELADQLEASEAHLAKVMQRLGKAGLVRSTRGPKGGFVLGRPADSVSLLDVYEAIEGPIEPSACLFGRPVCGRKACIFGDFLTEFESRFRTYLANATLEALVEDEEKPDGRA